MKVRTRALAATAALAAAGSALFATAPAAQAANRCPSDHVCLFQFENFGGQMRSYNYSVCNYSLGSFNNRASSMINNTPYRVVMFSRVNRRGTEYIAQRHSSDKTFKNNHLDNTIASMCSVRNG